MPLEEILKDGTFELVTTEVFGPVQASLCNSMSHSPLLSCIYVRMISHSSESLTLLHVLASGSSGIVAWTDWPYDSWCFL